MVTKHDRGNGTAEVTFSVPSAIWADSVQLVGSFNDWSITAHPLELRDDSWQITLTLPVGEVYEYRYLINANEWHNDWHADSYAPNVHGGDNSVVDLTNFSVADPEVEAERAVGG